MLPDFLLFSKTFNFVQYFSILENSFSINFRFTIHHPFHTDSKHFLFIHQFHLYFIKSVKHHFQIYISFR